MSLPSYDAVCEQVNQHFLTNSGMIGPETYQRGRETDPIWLGLFDQKPWQNHAGQVIKNTIYERSGLTAAPTWEAVNPSNGVNTNACIPPVTTIHNSATTQEFQRYHTALESDPLCLEDIRDSTNPKQAIKAFQNNLMDNANYVRKERRRSEYFRLSNHKIVAASGLPEDETAFPLTQPTSALTLGILRRQYPRLRREKNGTPAVATGSRGQKLFIVVTSLETIENIIKNDESGTRDDFRWSSRADELLGGFGADKISYGGFIFWQDDFPERYNWSGSAFVRVPEYTPSATTIGNKLDINQYWEHAQFEVSYIIEPDVMTPRVPSPNLSFGDVTYAAQNYALEWRWVNEYNRVCNPDRKIGFFRAVGMDATEPVFRQLGYAIIHKRCDAALDLVDCASGSGYNSGPFN